MYSAKERIKDNLGRAGVFALRLFLIIYTTAVITVGAADYFIPEKMTVMAHDSGSIPANASAGSDSYTVTAKLFGIVPIKQVNINVIEDTKLVPSGKVFGVKFFTKGVIITNLADIETKDGTISPAKSAGLQIADIIISVDGMQINTVEELAKCFEESKGREVTVEYSREGEIMECKLRASLSLSDKTYKTGIWVRDSTAGIGTMTFYNPANNTFAGLGHGICDVDTGELMPLLRGSVVDVTVTDIVKGRRGSPGEMKGNFDFEKRGALTGNTNVGVYGVMDEKPDCAFENAISIATADEVKEGKASIYTELDEEGICEYEAEISKLDKNSADSKNFVVTITDERLLEKTGGIVQGMSGSPIVQNGKLIGAITHVLVNDPQKGYGILIENMLSSMPKMMR